MASKRSTTLTTIIDVEARVDKARKALSDFSKSLGNVNLSDSMTSNVQKTLGKLEQELTNFQGLSSKEIFSEKDAKQVQKSFEKIGDLLNTLSAQAKTIKSADLSKLVPKEALNQLKDFGATLKDLKSQQKTLYAELSEKTKAASKAEKEYSNTLKKREGVQNDIKASDEAEKRAKEKVAIAQEKINKLTQEKQKIESKRTKAQSEIDAKQKELDVVNETIKRYKEYQALKQKANKTSGEKGAVTRYENANEKTIRQAQAGVFTKKKKALTSEIAQLETVELSPEEQVNLEKVEQAIAQEEEIVKKQTEIANKARSSSSSASLKLAKLEGSDNLEGLKKAFEDLKAQVDDFDTSLDSQKVEEFRKQLSEFADVSIDQIPTDLAEIQKYLEEMTRTKVDEVAQDVKNLGNSARDAKAPMEEMREGISKAVNEGKGFDDVGKEIDRLKQNVIDFFSIGNTIQLFKRAVQSAFDTVKELDETMTEAAVVTDFSVGDMWEQLPTYSAEAKKLGVSINELYGATTLYYQQGTQVKFNFLFNL